jgi:calcium-dependent protein kinase
VKIIDFGLAGIVRQLVSPPEKRGGSRGSTPASQTGRAGTAIYLAPELATPDGGIKYTPKCDMWSLGILMHILLTGEHPFWDKRTPFKDFEMMKRILDKPVDIHSISPEAAGDLISKLLVVHIDSRLSAHEALMHPCMRVSAFLGSELHQKLMTNLRSYKRFRPIERVVLTILAYHSRSDALREVFSLLDTDMNGVLSKQEIVTGMNRLGLMLPSDFDEILDSIDADGSGEIEFTEFMAAGLSADQVRDESLIDCAFGWLSSDNSGQISLKDLQAAVPSSEAELTIQKYASDGRLYLTRSDFSRLITDIASIKEMDGSDDSPVSLAKTQSRRRLSWDQQSAAPRISFPNPFRTLSDNTLKRADSSR